MNRKKRLSSKRIRRESWRIRRRTPILALLSFSLGSMGSEDLCEKEHQENKDLPVGPSTLTGERYRKDTHFFDLDPIQDVPELERPLALKPVRYVPNKDYTQISQSDIEIFNRLVPTLNTEMETLSLGKLIEMSVTLLGGTGFMLSDKLPDYAIVKTLFEKFPQELQAKFCLVNAPNSVDGHYFLNVDKVSQKLNCEASQRAIQNKIEFLRLTGEPLESLFGLLSGIPEHNIRLYQHFQDLYKHPQTKDLYEDLLPQYPQAIQDSLHGKVNGRTSEALFKFLRVTFKGSKAITKLGPKSYAISEDALVNSLENGVLKTAYEKSSYAMFKEAPKYPTYTHFENYEQFSHLITHYLHSNREGRRGFHEGALTRICFGECPELPEYSTYLRQAGFERINYYQL